MNITEKDLKAALFEIFSAGFISAMADKDIVSAYNEYWEYLIK